MCIEIYAVPTNPNRVSDSRLTEISGLTVTKSGRPAKGALHFSRGPGCSCSLLAEECDLGTGTWKLDPEVLDGLTAALKALYDAAEGFTFQALWIGDESERVEDVLLKTLIQDARENRIRDKYTYKIGAMATEP
jgi:hypothetical protein